ncbi:hypothetical protein HOS87_gp48 [Pseudomonas phage phiNV3]|uniref:Uncharacterized protein n=1 Tax=Pseudomonas phage phiNV3 TaxID=2079544 RepID=A0A2P0ZLL9_9CAUD|nr:hypothetical protein [Pseudomonas tolaasii]YP_009799028.1 hypothetical protein HOS87_gp48 [Pseudomonas phage phiNV3]ARB30334.1 hypothetical protein B5P22_24610 [Pseudomonas tolaasii]AVH86157.1 hypothetical protein phiNV3_p48 [Pseudomonas phage phiNV3]
MATPTLPQVVALNRAIHTAKLTVQNYGQSERKLDDLTLAENKAVLVALKTALDAVVTTIG